MRLSKFMEKDSTGTCYTDIHHHWVKKSLSHKLLRNSLEKHHYTIVFPQHLLSPCHRQDPRAAWPFTLTKWHSHTLLAFSDGTVLNPVNSKKQSVLGTSHLQNNSHPSQNSLKNKGSLVYSSSCLLKKRKKRRKG